MVHRLHYPLVHRPAPEPVRTLEPVREPQQQRGSINKTNTKQKTGRLTCEQCGNTWPARCGTNCLKCPKPQRTPKPPRTQEPAQDEQGLPDDLTLPDSIFARGTRLNCRICQNSWPASFGANCRTCSSTAGSVKAVLWNRSRRRDSEVRSEAIDRERRARLSPA